MQISKLLLHEHSKKQTMKIVRFVGGDQKKFDALMKLCLGKDVLLAQRASWTLGYCVELHPEMMKMHLKKMLKFIRGAQHPAIRRNFVKIMSLVHIPPSLESESISVCFDLLHTKSEFVAIRVYAMYYLESCCKKYPDLWIELIATIQYESDNEKPAFKAGAKKVILNYRKFKIGNFSFGSFG